MNWGFIITRCVKETEHNKFWNTSLQKIHHLYGNNIRIIIIDDGSDAKLLVRDAAIAGVHFTEIFAGPDFRGAGELLPYWYYLHNRYFDVAVVLQDSIFLQQRLPETRFSPDGRYVQTRVATKESSITDASTVSISKDEAEAENKKKDNENDEKKAIATELNGFQSLWHFANHSWDDTAQLMRLLHKLSDTQLVLDLGAKPAKWSGCFGSLCVMPHTTLCRLQARYNFPTSLIGHVTNRDHRMALERLLGVLLVAEGQPRTGIFGEIMAHPFAGQVRFGDYELIENLKKKYDMETIQKLFTMPAFKVWAQR